MPQRLRRRKRHLSEGAGKVAGPLVADIELGDCHLCGQCRILGQRVAGLETGEIFRCCGCIDRYGCGWGSDVKKMHSDRARLGSEAGATNWWAASEAPPSLADVPPGSLSWQRCAFAVDSEVVAVVDPQHNYFTGHGVERVWAAAIALVDHLAAFPVRGLSVVELGAGCGVSGIAMAKRGAHVTLTDLPWTLRHTLYNVEANFADEDPLRPDVRPLRWGHGSDALEICKVGHPDLLIGTDVVYREDAMYQLLDTIAALRARLTIMAVAHREGIVAVMRKRLASLGWQFEEFYQAHPICAVSLFHFTTLEAD